MNISVILMHWRIGGELHPIQRLINNLQAEMHSQDLLGWDKFCYKNSFLEDSGQTSLGEVGMTKVLRHIWELQKEFRTIGISTSMYQTELLTITRDNIY